MIVNGTLSSWQAISTLGCVSIIPLILTLPTFACEEFGTGTFLQVVYMTIIMGLFLLLYFKLYSKFKDKDIIDISEMVGGNFLKYVIALLIIGYLFSVSIFTLSEFNENMRNILFSDAPPAYISLLFIIAVFLGALLGIKGVFRVSALVTPIIILGFVAMLLSLLDNIDIMNFTPVFGNGIEKIFLNGATRFGRYESLAVFSLIAPNLKNLNKTIGKTFGLVSFFIIISFFLLLGIIPYPTVTENYFPLYEITRLISYGRFIQRVESIFVLIWLVATFIYLTIAVLFIVNILKKVFNIEYYKRLISPVLIIILSISLMLSSYIQVINMRNILFIYITPFLLFIFPLAILIVANVKEKKGRKNENV